MAQRTEEYFGPAGCDADNMLRDAYAPAFAEIFRRCREESGIARTRNRRSVASKRPSG